MGYSLDLFLNQQGIDEEFLCSICHDVMKDPSMSETCEHIFCSFCLQEWKKSSSTCPIDREPIVGLRIPFRAFMNVLNRFKLKCSFDGCDTVTSLGHIEEHFGCCEFNPEAIKPCVGNCGGLIKMKEIPNHDCFQYLKKQVHDTKEENDKLKEEIEKCKTDHADVLRLKQTEIEALNWKIATLGQQYQYCSRCRFSIF